MDSLEKARRWAKGQAHHALKHDFLRFCVVGTIGFLLTAVGLRLLHGVFGMSIIPATFISSEVGLISNFVFHQNWTYNHVDHSHKSLLTKFIHFHMSSWSGVVLITILESVGVNLLGLNYLISLALAAGITMFWNFFWTKYYIFRGKELKAVN